MVSEVLSKMITRAEIGFISGCKVGSSEVSISHLQFADDTMIFCEADVRQVGYLRCILRCFEVVLGLRTNLAKSEIYSVGENCDIASLAWLLGCKIGSLLASYLGLPLEANYKAKAIRQPVIERISSHLESWRKPLLSKGGRLTLVNATLAVIPNYFLSLFTISTTVANRMEAMFRRFLCDDWANHHRYHLVDWECHVVALCVMGG